MSGMVRVETKIKTESQELNPVFSCCCQNPDQPSLLPSGVRISKQLQLGIKYRLSTMSWDVLTTVAHVPDQTSTTIHS